LQHNLRHPFEAPHVEREKIGDKTFPGEVGFRQSGGEGDQDFAAARHAASPEKTGVRTG
jgi:hypothetical protein